MFEPLITFLDLVLWAVRPAVFAAGAIAAVGALASYGVRTRKISPFSGLARFVRERIDPWLIAPMEKRLLRAGGTPYSAPWWSLALVVVGGLVLISAIGFVRDQLWMLSAATQQGGLMYVAVRWTFGILQLALFARVIASWVGGSPYSKWWRWSFVITEPILGPLRRIVPTIGVIDITVLVAYFGLQLLESFILRAL